MKRLLYGGTAILTGDLVADAVLDYAIALARAEQADHVRVPARDADGAATVYDILIGPASQLVAEPAGGEAEELEDEEFVAELRHRSLLAAAGRTDQIGLPEER